MSILEVVTSKITLYRFRSFFSVTIQGRTIPIPILNTSEENLVLSHCGIFFFTFSNSDLDPTGPKVELDLFFLMLHACLKNCLNLYKAFHELFVRKTWKPTNSQLLYMPHLWSYKSPINFKAVAQKTSLNKKVQRKTLIKKFYFHLAKSITADSCLEIGFDMRYCVIQIRKCHLAMLSLRH